MMQRFNRLMLRILPAMPHHPTPAWVDESLKVSRKGLDMWDWWYRLFNKTGLYEMCLKSTPRFATFVVLGSFFFSIIGNEACDRAWLRLNRGKVWQHCPYTYPVDDDDEE
eukprot:Filipodium_phascolosomae@DN1290_c0_g1_i1.p1